MKKFIKSFALTLAFVLALTSFPSSPITHEVNAASYVIMLDNRVLTTQNPVQNINNRILLPFREIGEAMGAEVLWYEADARIVAYLGNRYSIMFVGSPVVTFGTYAVDDAGFKTFTTTQTQVMDVAPTIINSRTYIPVRSIAETLGAKVGWDGTTGTATITSSNDTTSPVASPTPSKKPDNYNDFSNNSYFRTISSTTLKNMYQDSNNTPFMFVLYDSSEESSKMMVPNLQDAAQARTYRIYGVDMNDSNNTEADIEWIWSFFRENEFKDPTLYSVYSKSKVEQLQQPNDMDQVDKLLKTFAAQSETDVDYGDFSDTTYFKTKKASYIQDMYESLEEFVVVLYDSTDEDSKTYIPYIKAAAAQKKILVYGLDIDKNAKFYNTVSFMSSYRYDATGNLPAMFLVYEGEEDPYTQPTSTDRAVKYLEEFIKNADSVTVGTYEDINTSTRVINSSITDIKSRYNRSKTFVLFLYDSSESSKKDTNEGIYQKMHAYGKTSADYYYSVNLNSSEYPENKKSANYSWLFDETGIDIYAKAMPALIYFKSGVVPDIDKDVKYGLTISTGETFLENH